MPVIKRKRSTATKNKLCLKLYTLCMLLKCDIKKTEILRYAEVYVNLFPQLFISIAEMGYFKLKYILAEGV
jgi:hypothetical protein